VSEVLQGIFNVRAEEGGLTSVKALIQHPLFQVTLKEDLTDVSGPLSATEKEMLKLAKKGGGDGKTKKTKTKKSHSSKSVGITSRPEDAEWSAGATGEANDKPVRISRTYYGYDGEEVKQRAAGSSSPAKPKTENKPAPVPEPEPAPAMAALPPPPAAPAASAGDRGGRGAEPSSQPPPAPAPAAAPKGKGKGKGGGKGAPPARGGPVGGPPPKPVPPRPKPAASKAGMDSNAAAGATLDAISNLGSPGAVLSLLKKAKKTAPPKKELSFKEQLAAKMAGR